MSAVVRCDSCGMYVPLKNWPHKCGSMPEKMEINFKALSHKQVLDYYVENPEEVEPGLHDVMKEVAIFRGRIDLVGRDSHDILCLIEVVHRSNYDRAFWLKKLWKYRRTLRTMGTRIYKCPSLNMRLLLKKPGHETEDVTHTLD